MHTIKHQDSNFTGEFFSFGLNNFVNLSTPLSIHRFLMFFYCLIKMRFLTFFILWGSTFFYVCRALKLNRYRKMSVYHHRISLSDICKIILKCLFLHNHNDSWNTNVQQSSSVAIT